jgi:endonuclease/exonuclease/phosphatase family metal-dependent hydrolase
MLRTSAWRRGSIVALFTGLAMALMLAAPAAADSPPANAQRRLGVMTYNLYLGADLTPVIAAPPDTFVEEATNAWAHVQAFDFGVRAKAIAKAIAAKHPHLVGLQEVMEYETAPSPAGPFTTRYDYLAILFEELAALGTPYEVVVENPYIAVGPVPVATDPPSLSFLRFTQGNAIIARADLEDETLFTTNPVARVFQAFIPLTVGGQPLRLTRGYATVDVQFRGKWFRFATAHPEAFNVGIRKLQAQELASALAASPYEVILAGDLNSHRDFAGDSWQILTGSGLTDVWTETMPGDPGYTATFGDDLVGPPSELDHTVDYVLRSAAGTLEGVAGEAEVVGDEIEDKTSTGWWPSDHAGVFTTIRIVKD